MARWTENDIRILKSFENKKLTKDFVCEQFENKKSYDSIKKKWRLMNIKMTIKLVLKRTWTKEEEQIILNNYDTPYRIFELVNRSKAAIQQKLSSLNIILRKKITPT